MKYYITLTIFTLVVLSSFVLLSGKDRIKVRDRDELLPNVKKLISMMPLKCEVEAAGTKDEWKKFESKIGSRFPDDYYQFVRHYGIGGTGRGSNPFGQDPTLKINSPFFRCDHHNIEKCDNHNSILCYMKQIYPEIRFIDGERQPHCIVKRYDPKSNLIEECESEELTAWPEKDGVIQIGVCGSEMVTRICYRMKGTPEEWTILVGLELLEYEYTEFKMGLVDFLILIMENYPNNNFEYHVPLGTDHKDSKIGQWFWR